MPAEVEQQWIAYCEDHDWESEPTTADTDDDPAETARRWADEHNAAYYHEEEED